MYFFVILQNSYEFNIKGLLGSSSLCLQVKKEIFNVIKKQLYLPGFGMDGEKGVGYDGTRGLVGMGGGPRQRARAIKLALSIKLVLIKMHALII